jgi:hypothetical protein
MSWNNARIINAEAFPLVVLTERLILALVRALLFFSPPSIVRRILADVIILAEEVFRLHRVLA